MHKEAEKFANSNMMEGFLSIQSVLWGAKHAANTRSIQKVFVSDRHSGKKEREISQPVSYTHLTLPTILLV